MLTDTPLQDSIVVDERIGWYSAKKHIFVLTAIIFLAACLRLIPYVHFSGSTLTFSGTCGQLLDEAKPLYDSKNPLYFEVFFYPPLAPMLVASTGIITAAISHSPINFAIYCLIFSIGISLASLIVVYFIGREWNAYVGLVACSFYAVSMIAVDCANTVQAYATFFSMLALYFFYRSFRNLSRVNLSLMGICLGLGVASKYFPVMLSGMLVLLALRHRKDNREKETSIVNSPIGGKADFWVSILVWTMLTSLLVVLSAGLLYREAFFSMFKSIYNAHPHDHTFDFHLAAINQLYRSGLIVISAPAVALIVILYFSNRKEVGIWSLMNQMYQKHWRWLVPCLAMILTAGIMISIPAILNLNNYLRYTLYITKSYGSADSGFFPAGKPAPSYLLSYFPENLGLPLFILSMTGVFYCLFSRDIKASLLFVIGLPLYVALELSSVKVNRFALDLMPILCLFAGVWVVSLSRHRSKIIRVMTIMAFVVVLSYSMMYSLAWAKFEREQQAVPDEAAKWIKANIPVGTRIGLKAEFWLSGSPHLLPDPRLLSDYEEAHYTSHPEVIVLPKAVYEIIKQYASLTRSGYVYTEKDWSPHGPPTSNELKVFMDLLNEGSYELIKEFEVRPTLGQLNFGPQALTGETWFLEHAGPYGMRIYRKRSFEPRSYSGMNDMGGHHVQG